MKYLSDKLFREDLNLEKRWWHRLAKIFFIILSIFILIGSAFGFYSAEEESARQYKIVKNFSEYLKNEKEKYDQSCPPETEFKDKLSLICFAKILIPESFVSQNDLSNYSLGCLNKDGVPEYLSEYNFKNDITCDQKTGLNCHVPKNICGGIASNIVRYDYEIKYGFYNYFSIAVKTLGVFLGWVLLTYLIYYKALLYIIFGGKKHTDHAQNH